MILPIIPIMAARKAANNLAETRRKELEKEEKKMKNFSKILKETIDRDRNL